MEQLYLIEIFVDKVSIFASEDNEKSGARKCLTVKIKFGPKVQFIIREGQLAPNDEGAKDDIIECNAQGRRQWSRTIRVGKSYLFPSYPDTVLMVLEKFPLEIEVWDDDENEKQNIFVGIGTMRWDTAFYHMLKEATNPHVLHQPLTIKTVTTLYAECCCNQAGDISFILRLSALGDSIITEYQQLMKDPDSFVFRTNKAPSMFNCKRIEGDDPNFCMVGSLYETTTLEDPDVIGNAQQKIEICTELQSCGVVSQTGGPICQHEEDPSKKKKYAIDKIRMGDITGPCGNANCALAHKVKNYIRALETYKQEAAGKVSGTKDRTTSKVCGGCCCKDDRYHREECRENQPGGKANVCSGCGGVVPSGASCEERKKKMFGTGATPKGSKTQVAYVFSVHHVPDFKESIYGRNFIVENLDSNFDNLSPEFKAGTSKPIVLCSCKQSRQPTSLSSGETSNGERWAADGRDLHSGFDNRGTQSDISSRNATADGRLLLDGLGGRVIQNDTYDRAAQDTLCGRLIPSSEDGRLMQCGRDGRLTQPVIYGRNVQAGTNCRLMQCGVNHRCTQGATAVKTVRGTAGMTSQVADITTPQEVNVRTLLVGPDTKTPPTTRSTGTNYPAYSEDFRKYEIPIYHCSEIPEEKDCKCDPPKPSPPCKTFDCDCITEIGNIEMRKIHKPYCPSYKHKSNCPVTMMYEEEEGLIKKEDDEDETEPLPYGLPPIRLGPCPVLGRPCTVPDGFARMYKVAVQPTLPPSYDEAGKVCCSKEYDRIKRALKEYMKYEKEHDFRCINKFNVDTEKRCCDKEQRLLALMGKGCCGSHKMATPSKFKDDDKKPC